MNVRTPARVFLGTAGTSLRTRDLLELRTNHAAAQDAVRAPFDAELHALTALAPQHDVLFVDSAAADLTTHLRRPDLGRRLNPEAIDTVLTRGTLGSTVQLMIGDGLSARAVGSHAPAFVARFAELAATRGWSLGRPIVVRHARVALMNVVGELLSPEVVLLLIGERPGLDSHASMSAYFGYRPTAADTDAERNLISNIQQYGLSPATAAEEAVAVVERLLRLGASGVAALTAD
ncbi:MAG TPA: ethanolamine ammonia-lyase subunit EutC [Jatrophihabitans sp.]|jgi:ethanolamine ammonia-lyase small subunit